MNKEERESCIQKFIDEVNAANYSESPINQRFDGTLVDDNGNPLGKEKAEQDLGEIEVTA
ncbi:MAG: hypothetical protein N4A47_05020 [Clostridia bacterium]|jgi:hypothetical protein|nr:hypothetical protein [Clostridia bacterium]